MMPVPVAHSTEAAPRILEPVAAALGGAPLTDSLGATPLAHPACQTCGETGLACTNA